MICGETVSLNVRIRGTRNVSAIAKQKVQFKVVNANVVII